MQVRCRQHADMCPQVYSARTALVGCNALTNMWSHLDTEQLTKLREKLRELQDSGVVFPEDAWTGKLLRPHPRHAPASESSLTLWNTAITRLKGGRGSRALKSSFYVQNV